MNCSEKGNGKEMHLKLHDAVFGLAIGMRLVFRMNSENVAHLNVKE